MAESGPPAAETETTTTVCTVHADRETLLTCIRCERPFCRECMEHFEAGLICHECLGLPPPEVQRKNAAIREVLFLTGIASIFGLIQMFIGPLSWFAILLGVLAGWMIGRRLRASWQHSRRLNVYLLGASGLVQGTILAAMVRIGLGGLGILALPAAFGGLQGIITLVIVSFSYLLAAMAALAWSVTRH